MVKTRSMARKKEHDASSMKRPWSDLDHDVLYSVMMRLGVVEFVSFSGVCKAWRSLALSNRKTFMVSKPPMLMCISLKECHLKDFEGRKFKTIIPQLVGRKCVGLSCGYLILFGVETRDFWLVNPITKHELHFPDFPLYVSAAENRIVRAIVVFSPSVNGWVFVMLHKSYDKIWFSIAGKGAWNHVSSPLPLFDLHAFKGKIYTLNLNYSLVGKHIYEMKLHPVPKLVPKLTLSDTNFVQPLLVFDFVSSDENLYLMEYSSVITYKAHKLDFEQLNCMPCEKTMEEYAFFISHLKFSAAIKSGSWAWAASSYCEQRFAETNDPQVGRRLYIFKMWYFPHDCSNANLLDE